MSDISIDTLCADCKASPLYAQSISQHGQTCTVESTGQTLTADSINETCNRLLVGMAKTAAQACGLSPADRKAARQKRRADKKAKHEHDEALRGQFATAMSQQYGLQITPKMIGIGIIGGIFVLLLGGIPLLLLCVASVCFEHWLEQELFDDPKVTAIA